MVLLLVKTRGALMKRFGKYEIVQQLGVGGMAIVYRARDILLGRDVALKVIGHQLKGGEAAEQRFLNEARVIAGLTHPNIVVVYDLGVESGTPFIAMEYLPGCDLRDLIDRAHPLSLEQRVDLVIQIAEALDHAHSRGVIHRDVKPGNIRVLRDGKAKLMDFGIAKFATQSLSKLTQTGTVLGSVSYMAPEQIRSQELTPGSDVFSLGVVMYEVLTGRLPFTGPDTAAILWKISFEPPEPFSDRDTVLLSEDLRRLVLQCLVKDRQERFPGFRPFIEQLSRLRKLELLSDLPQTAQPAPWIPDADAAGSEEVTPVSGPLPSFETISASMAETMPIPEPLRRPFPDRRSRRAAGAVFAALLGMALSGVVIAVWLPARGLDAPRRSEALPPAGALPQPVPRSGEAHVDPPRPPAATPAPVVAPPPEAARPVPPPPQVGAIPPAPTLAPPPPPPVETPQTSTDTRLAREIRQSRLRVRDSLQDARSRGIDGLAQAERSVEAADKALSSGQLLAAQSHFDEASRAIEAAIAQHEAVRLGQRRVAEQARQRAVAAGAQAAAARSVVPAVVREADLLLRAADEDLQRGAAGAAVDGFARAERVFQDAERLAARVAMARALAEQGQAVQALEQLAPLFQAYPQPGGAAEELRSLLRSAQVQLDARLGEARLALDRGDLQAARSALESLDSRERSLPETQELLRRIDSRLKSDRQPPDVQVVAMDYKVETPLVVELRVIDTSGVASVTFFAECSGEDSFKASRMEPAGQDLFRTVLEPKRHQGKTIRYYVEAVDLAGNVRSVGTAKKPIKLKSAATFSIVGPPG
jgi:serine/threonine-protein kinase